MYAEMTKGAALGNSRYADGPVPTTGYSGDAAARQLEIPAGLERLDRQITSLAEYIAMLDDRLTGKVARSQAPSPENKVGTAKLAMQCGIGGHLDALGDHVQGLRDRLSSLFDRLEV